MAVCEASGPSPLTVLPCPGVACSPSPVIHHTTLTYTEGRAQRSRWAARPGTRGWRRRRPSPTSACLLGQGGGPHRRATGRGRRGAGGERPRRRKVAALIAQGLTSAEIAERLVITPRTADTHADNIRSKLGLRSRTEIASWATGHGLSSSDPQHA
ncbi:MAG: helix-turn-helix transcriptional regulator [Chloroflexi bacterium]|nr:helix-turn-helix transcriptional regulator [Chloroflexota bacterium]